MIQITRGLRAVLWAVFAAAAAVLMAWVFKGPFHLILPVNNPLNAEGIVALSFLLLALLRSGLPGRSIDGTRPRSTPIAVAAVAAITFLAFLPSIHAPLLYDAYTDVWNAATQTWPDFLRPLYVHSADGFFRPLAYATYRLDYKWAGSNPVLWNLWNFALHVLNSCLVWALARQLSAGRLSAAVAALVFGLHGTRPEAAAWVGERLDLLAAFFSIAALLAVNRSADTGAGRWYAAAGFFAFCGILSKESAYCLPFLALLLMPFRERFTWPRILRAAALITAVCAAGLLYRVWLIGGIGGYTTKTGVPEILRFSALRTVKALLFRQWALLFFPVNWSSTSLTLQWAMALMVLVAAGFLIYSRANRRHLAASLLWVIAAGLPVQHMMLLGSDLNGARVLYLPVLGLALFWGFLVEGCMLDDGARIARILLPAGLLLFQLVALEHNLNIWRGVAYLSQRTCRAMGAELRRDPRAIVVGDLPRVLRGVFFLRNGFPQCVAINTGQPIDRVSVLEDNPAGSPGARLFLWNSQTERLEERGGPHRTNTPGVR